MKSTNVDCSSVWLRDSRHRGRLMKIALVLLKLTTLRQILSVSWTVKTTSDWVFEKAARVIQDFLAKDES